VTLGTQSGFAFLRRMNHAAAWAQRRRHGSPVGKSLQVLRDNAATRLVLHALARRRKTEGTVGAVAG
jgi:hypothetical protein